MCIRCAISAGDAERVERTLLAGNISINGSYDGRTALDFAVMQAQVECMRLLLQHGANPNLAGREHSTSLHLAIVYGSRQQEERVVVAVVQTLLVRARTGLTANPDVRNMYGQTPLHLIANSSSKVLLEPARILLQQGRANPNIQDMSGQTPLHVACLENKVELTKLLLENGADMTKRDKEGSTVLDLACFIGSSPELLRVLLQHKGSSSGHIIDPKSHRHHTSRASLLQQGVGSSEVLKVLLEFGVNPNKADPVTGKLALDLACETDSLGSIFVLFKRMVGDGSIRNRREVQKRKRLYQIRWEERDNDGSSSNKNNNKRQRPARRPTQSLVVHHKPNNKSSSTVTP